MELVYLWVDNYKNIKEQGFNFSGRYQCYYDEAKNELTLKKNKRYTHIFPNNINITAIIGENGVGKSAILEILNSGYDGIFLIFYKQDSDEFLFHQIKISGFNTQNIKSSEILNQPVKFGWYNENSTSLPLSTVFYTNIVNNRTDEVYYGDEVANHKKNISTGYLIHKINTYIMEMSPKENFSFPFVSFYNQYKIAQSEDVKLTIDYLKNTNPKLPFPTPKTLVLEINSRLLKNSKFMNKYTHEGIKDFTLGSGSINYLKRAIIYNFLDYHLLNNTYLPNQDYFIELADQECLYDDKNQDIDNLYKAFNTKFNQSLQYKYDVGLAEISFFQGYFKTANEFLDICKQIVDEEDGHRVYCLIENIPNNFIELYQKLITAGLPFLTFTFSPHMSSGQENFLYMFGRFYSALRTPISNDQLEENILFCIDEGELTLHPDWQKQYIKIWMNFLSKNFQDYNIHLILTSHSPFILSDIPKSNILFLKDGKNINSEVDINPFGANIHTLLSHGFFMKNGLMGEFAKDKINEAIKYLNQKTLTKEELAYCENIVSIIGEPILKRQLQKMLDSKRLSKIDKIDLIEKQIKELQEELKKVKK